MHKLSKNINQLIPDSVAMSEFSQFMASSLGKAVLDHEKTVLNQQLPGLVGYNLLQLSAVKAEKLCDDPAFDQRIGHYIRMGFAPGLDEQLSDHLWADYQAFPVASDCVDIVLLHHVLEFSKQPHQLLREADRTLTQGGHMIILGFNPISSWSIYRAGMQWRYPWLRAQQALSRHRVYDWLSLLNYEAILQKNYFYRPCIANDKVLEAFSFMDKIGDALHLPSGLFYLIVAKKCTYPVNPVKSFWPQKSQTARSTVINFNHAAAKLIDQKKRNNNV